MLFALLIQIWLSDRIIGGHIVENPPQEIIQLQRGGRPWCTATLVGPRVILTAAHCAKGGVTYGRQSLKMLKHPRYSIFGHQHDVAIGILPMGLSPPYVTVATTVPVVGDDLVIAGYGCFKNGQYDNKLRAGETEISHKQGTDWVSSTKAAICYGDSGGPAFEMRTMSQIGVHSKGNISTRSWMADVTSKSVQDWLSQVAESQTLEICGVNLECKPDTDWDH